MFCKLVFLFLAAITVATSHGQTVLGSQIDFERLDSFQYEVRFQIFTDCRDSAFQLDSHSYCEIGSTAHGKTKLTPTLIAIRDISNYHDTVTHCGVSDTVLGVL